MNYQVIIERRAQRELRALPIATRRRIEAAVRALSDEPRPAGCRKLQGQDTWRIRVGDYRIIYEIHDDKLLVIVVRIGHRSDIYR